MEARAEHELVRPTEGELPTDDRVTPHTGPTPIGSWPPVERSVRWVVRGARLTGGRRQSGTRRPSKAPQS